MIPFKFNTRKPPFTEQEFISACDKFLEDYEDIDLEAIASVNDLENVTIYDLVQAYYFKGDDNGFTLWRHESQEDTFNDLSASSDAVTALYDLMAGDYYDMISDWLPDGYDTNDPVAVDEAIDDFLFDKYMEED